MKALVTLRKALSDPELLGSVLEGEMLAELADVAHRGEWRKLRR